MPSPYRFSRGDRVQIISGKFKGETGIVDANVFQRSVDFPKDHLPCHHVLLDNHLVITINSGHQNIAWNINMNWGAFAQNEPELARLGQERFRPLRVGDAGYLAEERVPPNIAGGTAVLQ